jgi:trimethylamine--corrinoid protein Co-methyltransferase
VDSKLCDAQAGFEALLTALPAALAGANLIYGSGMVDSGMALDYGKLMMDDEINRAITHVLKGFEVNAETLSVGLIEEVGHSGNYLTHPSTLKHCGDPMAPKLMNRETYARWRAGGETSLHERALEKAREAAKIHAPTPISPQAQKEIDEIIRETEKELGVTNRF